MAYLLQLDGDQWARKGECIRTTWMICWILMMHTKFCIILRLCDFTFLKACVDGLVRMAVVILVWVTMVGLVWVTMVDLVWVTMVCLVWVTVVGLVWVTVVGLVWVTVVGLMWVTVVGLVWVTVVGMHCHTERSPLLSLPPHVCMSVYCTRPSHWRTNCGYKRQPITDTGRGILIYLNMAYCHNMQIPYLPFQLSVYVFHWLCCTLCRLLFVLLWCKQLNAVGSLEWGCCWVEVQPL